MRSCKDDPDITYNEAAKLQEESRLSRDAKAAQEKEGVKKYQTGKEIDYHRYWKDMYDKWNISLGKKPKERLQ